MKNNIIKFITVVVGVIFLTSCATTPEKCDPTVKQGSLDRLGCTVSGSYKKRVKHKEQEIEDAELERSELNTAYEKAKANQASSAKKLNKAKKTDKQLDADIARIKQQIADINNSKSGSDNAKKQAELQRLKKQLQKLEAQAAGK